MDCSQLQVDNETPGALFRVLRDHDEPSEGLHSTNSHATLTVEQHVCKGTTSLVQSQFISTTRDLSTALSWVIKERSALVVIYCVFLNSSINANARKRVNGEREGCSLFAVTGFQPVTKTRRQTTRRRAK